MMSIRQSNSDPADPFGCRQELEEVLTEPALEVFANHTAAGAESRQAAYEVAVALGRCRLFAVEVGDLDGTLPVQVALAAAEQLLFYLAEWTEGAQLLQQRWEESGDVEAEELCLELLEERMEVWAAIIAIEEAYRDVVQEGSAAEQRTFTEYVDRLLDAIADFDEELSCHKELLATAADTQLLENWRTFLASLYLELLPWWLDGSLEALADQQFQQMCQELPRKVGVPKQDSVHTLLLRAYRRLVEDKAAFAAAPEEAALVSTIKWISPDYQYKAFLHLSVGEGDVVEIRFYDQQGEVAACLANEPVFLDGVASRIDREGKTSFRRQELAQPPVQELRLEIGLARSQWRLQEV